MAQPVPAGKDNSKVFGIIGICLCWCFLGGLIFSILSIVQAGKNGSSKTLGYVGLALTVVLFLLGIIVDVTVIAGMNK
jgi:hypothetical protein